MNNNMITEYDEHEIDTKKSKPDERWGDLQKLIDANKWSEARQLINEIMNKKTGDA